MISNGVCLLFTWSTHLIAFSPETTNDFLLRCLSPKELYHCSHTSKDVIKGTESNSLLAKIFSSDIPLTNPNKREVHRPMGIDDEDKASDCLSSSLSILWALETGRWDVCRPPVFFSSQLCLAGHIPLPFTRWSSGNLRWRMMITSLPILAGYDDIEKQPRLDRVMAKTTMRCSVGCTSSMGDAWSCRWFRGQQQRLDRPSRE